MRILKIAGIPDTQEPVSVIAKLRSVMESKGYEVVSPRDERRSGIPEEEYRAIEDGNSRYLTFISSDGNVRIGVTVIALYYHENNFGDKRVWQADYESAMHGGEITVTGITTKPEARGQGLASNAMDDLVEAAKVSGAKLYAEPVVMSHYTEDAPHLDRKGLVDWYKRKGFDQLEEGYDDIITYKSEEEQ